MSQDEIYARQMTLNWFHSYRRRYPHKSLCDAVRAAWGYFSAFNQPMFEEARRWFEQNIGYTDCS